jgi:hypothetical protein
MKKFWKVYKGVICAMLIMLVFWVTVLQLSEVIREVKLQEEAK